MKKLIIIIFVFTSFAQIFSQTGYRIRQLANLNQHSFGVNGYSALWGWTAPNGKEYAILGCLLGTSFVDITDTSNIHEVAFLPIPNGNGGSNWREMKTYSHYVYIVSEAFGSNIQIADMQYLPDSVRYVGVTNFKGHQSTHSISQSGPYLYLNGCNPEFSEGIAVADLSVNPEDPILRGKWQTLYVHDCRIINDTIWACNIGSGKVSIINAANKDNLISIRDWTNNPQPNNPHNIAFTNDRHFAFVTDETTFPSPGRMKIWDVSDLGNITYINSFNAYPFEKSIVHNAEVYGNIMFLAYYTAGVKVLNISNPLNPVEIGWFDTHPESDLTLYDGCWGVYYFPSGKLIASDRSRGLFVLRPDLTTPVPGFPSVNFSVSENKITKKDTITFVDATNGIPASWQWKITGPENKTSSERYPKISFPAIGQYNVSLRAANTFGSDSISKTNVFRVMPVELANFAVSNPVGTPFYVINTSQSDTGRVLFNWSRSAIDSEIRYKLYFKKISSPSEFYCPSANNGIDTFALLTKRFLDSVALRLGTSGDSVTVTFRAKAYNETDSLQSGNSVVLIIKRTPVGIHNISEETPRTYKLYNNYPNPFNPTTSILFDIPKESITKLILYDIAGRELSKLVDNKLSAGQYKYSFNGSSFNSGIYFVKFSSGEFNSTLKIMLIK